MTLHAHPIRATVAPIEAPVHLRPARPDDAETIGRIGYEAFRDVHERHGFAPDFPSVEAAAGLAAAQIADPRSFGVVATRDGEIVGSNFLSEGDPVRGVGPITVHPEHQGLGIGRLLMQAVLDRGRDALGVRLVQDAFNARTMALYTSLGFDPREPLAVLTGTPRDLPPADARVRLMTPGDLRAAAALSRRVHGFARTAELQAALAQGAPVVLERAGRIAGYMAMPNFWLLNHAIAETEDDLRALILGAGAASAQPLGLLAPIRRAALFRWCLDQGMRVVKPMTLMSSGHYAEPDGAYLPSVMY
jgi:predicted N-acetyltransferase YhbS